MSAQKSPALVKLHKEYEAVLGKSPGGPKRNDPQWLRSKIAEADVNSEATAGNVLIDSSAQTVRSRRVEEIDAILAGSCPQRLVETLSREKALRVEVMTAQRSKGGKAKAAEAAKGKATEANRAAAVAKVAFEQKLASSPLLRVIVDAVKAQPELLASPDFPKDLEEAARVLAAHRDTQVNEAVAKRMLEESRKDVEDVTFKMEQMGAEADAFQAQYEAKMREMEEAVPAKPGPKTPPKHAQLSAAGELDESELVAAQVLAEQANLRAEVAAELDMGGPQPEPEPVAAPASELDMDAQILRSLGGDPAA